MINPTEEDVKKGRIKDASKFYKVSESLGKIRLILASYSRIFGIAKFETNKKD